MQSIARLAPASDKKGWRIKGLWAKSRALGFGALALAGLIACLISGLAVGPAKADPASLTFEGKLAKGRTVLTFADLAAMPQAKMHAKQAIMSTAGDFEGPRLSAILHALGATGNRVKIMAIDDYNVEVGMDEITQYDPIIALRLDGKMLSIRDKGPYWLMWPYEEHPEINNDAGQAKAVWQVASIIVE